MQGRVVDHVVLFHGIKLHSTCNLFLLLDWRWQTKKGAEFIYFPSSILENIFGLISVRNETWKITWLTQLTQEKNIVYTAKYWSLWGRNIKTTGDRKQVEETKTQLYLNHIFIEHVMNLFMSLFLLPPAVHMVIPGPKQYWTTE